MLVYKSFTDNQILAFVNFAKLNATRGFGNHPVPPSMVKDQVRALMQDQFTFEDFWRVLTKYQPADQQTNWHSSQQWAWRDLMKRLDRPIHADYVDATKVADILRDIGKFPHCTLYDVG
jgi:hypothetical protein